jgi:rRNA maturation protein Rpf1
MTAQSPEEFIYKGKRYQGLYAEPLDQYLQTQNIEFQPIASSCWRGYKCLWIISENKLYLTGFSGAIRIYTDDDEFSPERSYDIKNISLNELFPNQQNVFVEWFSGEIKLVRRVKLTGNDYHDTVYKKVIHLIFEKGILVNEEIIKNKRRSLPKWLRFW